MSEITLKTFVQSVFKYFEPMAKENGLMLLRRTQCLYEITTPNFVMRIRFDTGAHTKSLNATLIPTDQMPGDIDNGNEGELGVRVIAGFNGVPIEYIAWDNTEDGFSLQACFVADLARRYALPYLLNQKTNWDELKEFVSKKNEVTVAEIRQYKLPPNVQKRWHLPPESFRDEKTEI